MYKEIRQCRICGNPEVIPFLHLGEQYLTGVFPKTRSEPITRGPLELIKCMDERNPLACGLVQLRHSYDGNQMYGDNYGYRSGLNRSMVEHLSAKVREITSRVSFVSGDIVVDVGSNDGTLLKAYLQSGLELVGIDPVARKFRHHYPDHIHVIPEFFSAEAFRRRFGSKRAKVVTSIAMFYDLEDPIDFMRQIHDILADDGVWLFEQSYLPAMLAANAYDTICHEHLEYYALKQIKWMTDRADFRIIGVELNKVNGGSVSVTVAKAGSKYQESATLVQRIIERERDDGLCTLRPFEAFRERVFSHRKELRRFVDETVARGKTIVGYGASTKGNVILQFCEFTESEIPGIAEVNEEKFGRLTPGTWIPILDETEARAMKPDFFLVLPWHFRENLVAREREFLTAGGQMVFPLPSVDIVSAQSGA